MQKLDKWEVKYRAKMDNFGLRESFAIVDDMGGKAVFHGDHGTQKYTEVVRESAHFSKEQVEAVYNAIVLSKTGKTMEQHFPK
jgi:hypothetical protein